MSKPILAALILLPVPAAAQVIQPGGWAVKSTVADIAVPGVPGFLLRMMRGKSRAERKCVAAGQGVEVLLAPDPKARCTVDSQHVVDGRYAQALTCPQKRGDPVKVVRAGTYDAGGFAGRATMTGQTPKGAMNIGLDQRGSRVGATCSG